MRITPSFDRMLARNASKPADAPLFRSGGSGIGKFVGNRVFAAAIAADIRKHMRGLPPETAKAIIKGFMGRGGPVTVADLRRVDSHLREMAGGDSQIEVALPDDPADLTEIEGRFDAMFGYEKVGDEMVKKDGIAAFTGLVKLAFRQPSNVEISKAGDPDQEKIRVAFTDPDSGDLQFEFFFEKAGWTEWANNVQTARAEWRILCGDGFADRAARGDPHLKQITELLSGLVRYSKDHSENEFDSLKSAVFNVRENFDIRSLLDHGYGTESKWSMYRLIIGMAYEFEENDEFLKESMGDNRFKDEEKKIESIVNKLSADRMESGEFLRVSQFLSKYGYDSQNNRAYLVNNSTKELHLSEVMKIVKNERSVNVSALPEGSELRRVAQRMVDEQKGWGVRPGALFGQRVPLGALLLNMTTRKGGYFDLVRPSAAPAAPVRPPTVPEL